GDALENWTTPSTLFHFVINPSVLATPGIPTLTAPVNAGSWTAASLPDLKWTMNGVVGNQFEIQIDTSSAFGGSPQDVIVPVDQFTYSATALPAGTYYWHVRAINAAQVAGTWSASQTFTIQNTTPPAPVVLTPAQNANLTALHPTLTWKAVAGVKSY